MATYIVGTLLSMFFAFLYNKKTKMDERKISSKILAFFSAIPLFVIAAFRYNVGSDYVGYAKYFKLLLIGHNNEFFEAGFFYLTKAIQLITKNYIVFFFILSFIFIYFTYKAIYEESPNPGLSIFLLVATQYYFISMNAIRQFIALSIFLYSIRYIRKRNMAHYMVLNILASTIHNSIIILLPVYFLFNIKITPKKQALFLSVGFLLSSVLKNIILYFAENTKYIYYIDVDYGNHSAGYIMLAIEFLVLLLGWIFYNKKLDDIEQRKYNLYINMKMFSVFFALINNLVPLLFRIKWCFGFSTIIFIPMIIERARKVDKKMAAILKLLIYLFFSLYILYTVGVNNANDVLPYITIFDVQKEFLI